MRKLDDPIFMEISWSRIISFVDESAAALVRTAFSPIIREAEDYAVVLFDGNGNYALGLKEQIVFPEIDFDKIDEIRGMDVIICTTAKTDDEARELLRAFNMPFQGQEK